MPKAPDPEKMLAAFRDRCARAKTKRDKWLRQADEAQRFYDGHQWEAEMLEQLRDSARPALTFNRVAPIVDAVAGLAYQSGLEARFLPRTTSPGGSAGDDDSGPSDIANEAARYFRQSSGAEHEEWRAHKDQIVTGVGWTNTRIDMERDPDGEIITEYVSFRRMLPDPAAEKQNFLDAEYVICEETYAKGDFEARWPGELERIGENLGESQDSLGSVTPHVQGSDYRVDESDDRQFWKTGRVRVREYQWITREAYVRWADPKQPPDAGPALTEAATFEAIRAAHQKEADLHASIPSPVVPPHPGMFDPLTMNPDAYALDAMAYDQAARLAATHAQDGARLADMAARLAGAVTVKKRVYWRAFIGSGDTILGEIEESPCQDRFTFQAMTALWDPKECQYYGLVRSLLDPQRYANKGVSLLCEIISLSPKGGAIVKRGAVENLDEVEAKLTDPSSVIVVEDIAGIQPKPVAPINPQLTEFFNYCVSAPIQVTGVNPAILGQSGANTPVGTVAQYRRQGAANLAAYSDGLRRYRQEQARVMLELMRLLPRRLIRRIVGSDLGQWVEFDGDRLASRYDIIVDEAPSSPNNKAETFQVLQMLMPTLAKMGLPAQTLAAFLEYAPLPATLVAKLRDAMNQAPPSPIVPPNPAAMNAAQGMGQPQGGPMMPQMGMPPGQ